VTSRIGQLTQCLDLISYKVRVYEDHLAQGTASQLWCASSVPEKRITNPRGTQPEPATLA